MNAELLMELLFIAANAKTIEEKTRVAWRASDYMWREFPRYGFSICRSFNDLCGDQDWPHIKDLWSEEERQEVMSKYGLGTTNARKS
jgi:hypothetical protein